jgi:hypothetical protein
MKLQSDRQLAVYGQQGVISTWKAMKGIGSDIYSGVERVSWYSSCLSPDIMMFAMNWFLKNNDDVVDSFCFSLS